MSAILLRAGAIYFSQRAAGAGGNDPQTYVQMAYDFARNRTVLHTFPLADQIQKPVDARPDWYVSAFMTFGYRPACDFCSEGKPFFAQGIAWLLAGVLLIGGEKLIYWTLPAFGLLALVASGYLAYCLISPQSKSRAWLTTLVTMLILSCSLRQTTYALVPNSDLPAQFFTTCALITAVKSQRSSHFWWAVLTGICAGAAFEMRHPAALILLIIVILLYDRDRKLWQQNKIGFALVTFALMILPDMIYHQQYLGGILTVENPGSTDFAWDKLPRTIQSSLSQLSSQNEFGPLLPMMILGVAMLIRERRWSALVILVGLPLLYFALHMPLRLTGLFDNAVRYVMPAFPAIAIAIAYAISGIPNLRRYSVVLSGMLLVIVLAYLLAKLPSLSLRLDYRASAYGHLMESERQEYEALDANLPKNAVIITDAQELGAVQMYARRPTLYPWWRQGDWFAQFVCQIATHGSPIYAYGSLETLSNMENPRSRAYLLRYRWAQVSINGLRTPLYRLNNDSATCAG